MRTPLPALCLSVVLFSGCLKEELPVPARVTGGVVKGQACIGADYGEQLWYDLGSNAIVGSNSKLDWDLAFECGAEGWRVRLNTSRFMRACPTTLAAISGAMDTTGFGPDWRIDHPAGSPDSTAVRDWRTGMHVFAVDLGYNVIGLPMGIRQLRVVSVDAGSYTFEVAKLNGADLQTFTIAKDPVRSYVHFNMLSGQAVTIAPPRGQYDLVFTQYTHQFYEPYQSYIVTGAINGFSGARVARLINSDFGAVTLADTLQHPFTSDEDGVGYDWKDYDFGTSSYIIHPDHVFIVQDGEGFFYKMHFIDFYNEQGERGCPTFEVTAF